MKQIVFLVMLALAVMVASPAMAAGENLPIGVVDMQAVIRGSSAVKNINSQIEAKKKVFQNEISAQEEKLRKAGDKLKKDKAVLSEEKFKEKRKQFQNDVAKVQRDVQERRVKLEKAYAAALKQVQKKIAEIIKAKATAKKLEMVVPSSQILYADETMNMTDVVLKQLNSTLPKVAVKVK